MFLSKRCIISLAILSIFFMLFFSFGGLVVLAVEHNTATIVIDAGHGGNDGGVVGSQGQKESDINLAIAYLLQSELVNNNFNVIMTRTDKNSLAPTKKNDMRERKRIISKSHPNIVVSIHANKFSNKNRRGVQVFYDDHNVGKYFADKMQKALNTNINSIYSGRINLQALSGDFFITKCAPCPSIIVECGFLSNIEDEKLLMSVEYRKHLAKEISNVIKDIF